MIGILLRRDHAVEARAGQREYNHSGDHRRSGGSPSQYEEMYACEGGNKIDQEKGKYRYQPHKEKIAERVVTKPFCELPRTGPARRSNGSPRARARNKKNKRRADGSRANLCRDCAGHESKQKSACNGEKGRARKRNGDRHNVDGDEGNDGHHAVLVDEVVNNARWRTSDWSEIALSPATQKA